MSKLLICRNLSNGMETSLAELTKGAWAWALGDARRLVEDDALYGSADEHWIEICNGEGTVVATLPFGRLVLH